jgi:hypothetical protein
MEAALAFLIAIDGDAFDIAFTADAQEVFDPGHAPEVAWYLPGEVPSEL